MNSTPYVVLISGDRNAKKEKWYTPIKKELVELKDEKGKISVIHGGCLGIDTIAQKVCNDLDIDTKIFPADWGKYGKCAGPIRNKLMIEQNPDILLAYHDNIKESKGTIGTINMALEKGLDVKLNSLWLNKN